MKSYTLQWGKILNDLFFVSRCFAHNSCSLSLLLLFLKAWNWLIYIYIFPCLLYLMSQFRIVTSERFWDGAFLWCQKPISIVMMSFYPRDFSHLWLKKTWAKLMLIYLSGGRCHSWEWLHTRVDRAPVHMVRKLRQRHPGKPLLCLTFGIQIHKKAIFCTENVEVSCPQIVLCAPLSLSRQTNRSANIQNIVASPEFPSCNSDLRRNSR